jgi:hypothetical protein
VVAEITGKIADFVLVSRGKEYLAAYRSHEPRWACRRSGDVIQFHELPKRLQRAALNFANIIPKESP